jgi:hypothetical protein
MPGSAKHADFDDAIIAETMTTTETKAEETTPTGPTSTKESI